MQILRLYLESTDSEHAFNKIAKWSYKHSNLKKKKLKMISRISRRKPEFDWKKSEERKILHLPYDANSALWIHVPNAQEIADNICIRLASLLSGTHTCLHLLFTDKVSVLKWVAVSIYLCWNNHLVFIFFLWKNVHESIHSNLTS